MTARVLPLVLNEQYLRLLSEIDLAFDAANATEPSPACRSGCTQCCYGAFDVGPADISLALQGLMSLGDAERGVVMRRLREAASAERQAAAELSRSRTSERGATVGLRSLGEERFDELCDELSGQPCVFLDELDGRCLIYAYRPEPCRFTGLAWQGTDEALDLPCPIELNVDVPAVSLDLRSLHDRVARIDQDRALARAGIPEERTTLASGLDRVLAGRAGGT